MSTPTKRRSLMALGMLLLVVLFGAYFLGLFELKAPSAFIPSAGNATADEADAAAVHTGLDPAEVVQRFYDGWLEYGRFNGSPAASEYYQEGGFFSAAGLARLESQRGPQGWPADPVLCAQDLPEAVTVQSASVDGDSASVLAVTSWDTRLGVDLVQVGGEWLIDSITCLGR